MTRGLVPFMPALALSVLLAACATQDGGATNGVAQRAKTCADQIIAKATEAGLPFSLSYDGTFTRNDSYSTDGPISATVFSSQSMTLPYVEAPGLDGPQPGTAWRACMSATP